MALFKVSYQKQIILINSIR